jgi:hypothetical protein
VQTQFAPQFPDNGLHHRHTHAAAGSQVSGIPGGKSGRTQDFEEGFGARGGGRRLQTQFSGAFENGICIDAPPIVSHFDDIKMPEANGKQ